MHLEQVEVKRNKRDLANVQQKVANGVASWVVTDLAIFFWKDKFTVFNILATGKWFNENQNKINQGTDFHNGQDKENYLSKGAVCFSHHEYCWTVSQAPSKLEIRKIPLPLWLKTTVVTRYYLAYTCDIRQEKIILNAYHCFKEKFKM